MIGNVTAESFLADSKWTIRNEHCMVRIFKEVVLNQSQTNRTQMDCIKYGMDCIKYGGEGMQLRSAPSPPMAV
jgi:hypothetical protein